MQNALQLQSKHKVILPALPSIIQSSELKKNCAYHTMVNGWLQTVYCSSLVGFTACHSAEVASMTGISGSQARIWYSHGLIMFT